MKWTTDKPTQPGYYWYRQVPNGESVIRAVDYGYEDQQLYCWEDAVGSFGIPVSRVAGQWAGPIQVPEE